MAEALPGSLRTNDRGHLEVGGVDTVDLARTWGTPLYVLDEAEFRRRAGEYQSALAAYPGGGRIYYASKAFCTLGICRLSATLGLGLDVVSGGELYTARQAGFPMEDVLFHGNNKTEGELGLALAWGVGRVVLDNLPEAYRLSALAREAGKQVPVLLRVAPGIDPHTHQAIQTGGVDSKFGVPLAEAVRAAREVQSLGGLEFRGLHAHIGSQILEIAPFEENARRMVALAAALAAEGVAVRELDLGGGLGIRYVADDEPPSIHRFVRAVTRAVEEECRRLGLPLPRIILEPGRSLVGEAGITLYTAGSIKAVPGGRRFLPVDGGMGDNPRVALYGARYTALVANKCRQVPDSTVTVAGRCCESGDILVYDACLPRPEPGDVIAVLSTGAYNYSMASTYNRFPRPAVVGVYQGQVSLWVEREQYEDLIRLDRIPPHLSGTAYGPDASERVLSRS